MSAAGQPSARRAAQAAPAAGPLERSTTAILEAWQRCAGQTHRLGALALRVQPALAAGAQR